MFGDIDIKISGDEDVVLVTRIAPGTALQLILF